MAKNKFNKAWLNDHLTDPYVKLAKKAGYRSRAAFKLKEIAEQERLFKPGMRVVDLGSTPGSWSQVLREELVGAHGVINGSVIALDMLPMEEVAGVHFILGDFREEAVLHQLEAAVEGELLDLVVSDMAPNLSGVAVADSARIMHVCELAMEFAMNHLKKDGVLVTKTFHGSHYSQTVELFKRHFKSVKPCKPKASRDKSAETFLVARGLKE
ncbi:MAG: RlmE family RNA methyltransferase [Burkholderiales bacterium]|nr:RlmE family RNA methyltransferase [Burkholderiales bacterium]